MWKSLHQLYRSPTRLLVIGSLLLLLLINTLVLVWPSQSQLSALWHRQGERLSSEYAHQASRLLALEDRISLTVEVQRWARQDDVLGIEVMDNQGRVITESGQTRFQAPIDFSQPLYYENELLGTLTLWQDDAQLRLGVWRSLVMVVTSGALFASLGFWLWRRVLGRQQALQRTLNTQLQQHFPEVQPDTLIEPAQQTEQIIQQLDEYYHSSLQVMETMQRRLADHQLADIHQQYLASELPGDIVDGALVKIDLLNLDELDERLTPEAIKRLLDSTRQRCEDVMRLYNAESTQHPWLFLVRDHSDEGDFVHRALCAGYVLNHLLQADAQWGLRPAPQFSVSIMAGTLYAGIQTGGGLPVLTVFGHAVKQLDTLSLYNIGEQILVGEQTFHYAQLGNVVEAEIYRDIVMPDSETLEIWRLTGFVDNWKRVLERQIESLQERA